MTCDEGDVRRAVETARQLICEAMGANTQNEKRKIGMQFSFDLLELTPAQFYERVLEYAVRESGSLPR